jgi:hypothetical protein
MISPDVSSACVMRIICTVDRGGVDGSVVTDL